MTHVTAHDSPDCVDHGATEAPRHRGVLDGESSNTGSEYGAVEVHQQPYVQTKYSHVGQCLRMMHRVQRFHALYFDQYMVSDNEIRPMLADETPFVGHRNTDV